MDIVELYVILDDFCKKFMPRYIKLLKNKGIKVRNKSCVLEMSEIILIIALFPDSGYKCFKWYYIEKVCNSYRTYFPNLPSYNRFVELMPESLLILARFMNYLMYMFRKQSTGVNFIDSTRIPVCHNKRTHSHKVFSSIAEIGKSTMGWFYGFKLHFIIDIYVHITSYKFTKGNKDDKSPVLQLTKNIWGKLFGDKGYIGKELAEELDNNGITLITPYKKNMKARLLPVNFFDIIMSKKRVLIESVTNILKNKLQLCHTRHRSIKNFCVHLLAVLIGYQLSPNKPSISINNDNLQLNY